MLARGSRVFQTSLRRISSRGRPFERSRFESKTRVGSLLYSIKPRISISYVRQRNSCTERHLNPRQSLSWAFFAVIGATLTAVILFDPYLRLLQHSRTAPSHPSQASANQPTSPTSTSVLQRSALYREMPIAPGHLGNLTPEQELKLRDFWSLTLKTFAVKDPSLSPAAPGISATTPLINEPNTDSDSTKSSKKTISKKRHSLFSGKKHHDDDGGTESSSVHSAPGVGDENDKYGQTKEFQQTLKELSAEELRTAFWSMVKCDHPDALLLRFLRARKWDVQRALVMLISTMRWRSKEIHVDDDIMHSGEGGALADSKSGDSFAQKEGEDFLAQMRKGKSFLHGLDREGRPLCFVRVRLHKQGEQSERAMERYTVFIIETARLVLRPPVETATILFDMSSFTISNMDYAPVKFMIKIFEANYPESLGAVLVHRSPWVFQGIWSIIKGWLDPVVAAKVHFTKTVDDLERFIPRNQIVTELGGDEQWEYQYLEPVEGENERMKDTETRRKLELEREADVIEFQKKTFAWINTASSGGVEVARERDQLARRLKENYWALDPLIRARSLYDRQGMIGPGGQIDFYPQQNKDGQKQVAVDGVNGVVGTTASNPMVDAANPPTTTHADDVD